MVKAAPPIQRAATSQGRKAAPAGAQPAAAVQRTKATSPRSAPEIVHGLGDLANPNPNRTGLPDRLKAGIEALSGVSLDDVRVHRNSPRPVQLQADAFARGTEIHLGPGQERHLPHEAWHLVQQKQGRVRTTSRWADGTPLNESSALEQEADAMGARAGPGAPLAGKSAAKGPAVASPSEAPAQFSRGSKAANEELQKAMGKAGSRVARPPAAQPHTKKGTGRSNSGRHEKRNASVINRAKQDEIIRSGDPTKFSASRMRSDDRAVEKDAQTRERREEKSAAARTEKRAEKEAKIREMFGLGTDEEVTRDHREAYEQMMKADDDD